MARLGAPSSRYLGVLLGAEREARLRPEGRLAARQ